MKLNKLIKLPVLALTLLLALALCLTSCTKDDIAELGDEIDQVQKVNDEQGSKIDDVASEVEKRVETTTYAKDIADLQAKIAAAQKTLQDSITALQENVGDTTTAATTAFTKAQAELQAAYQAADAATKTALTDAFEAADAALEKAYKQADVDITTAYKEADTALTAAYKAADDALKAELKKYVDEANEAQNANYQAMTDILTGSKDDAWYAGVNTEWNTLVNKVLAKLEGMISETAEANLQDAKAYSYHAFNVIVNFIDSENYDSATYAEFFAVATTADAEILRATSEDQIKEAFNDVVESIEELPTLAESLYNALVQLKTVTIESTIYAVGSDGNYGTARKEWLKVVNLYNKVSNLVAAQPTVKFYRWEDAEAGKTYAESNNVGSRNLYANFKAAVENLEAAYGSVKALVLDIYAKKNDENLIDNTAKFVRLEDAEQYAPLRDNEIGDGDAYNGYVALQDKYFTNFALSDLYPAEYNTVGDVYESAKYNIDNILNYFKEYWNNGEADVRAEAKVPSYWYHLIFNRLANLEAAKNELQGNIDAGDYDLYLYTFNAIAANQYGGPNAISVKLFEFSLDNCNAVFDQYKMLQDWKEKYTLEDSLENPDFEGNYSYIYRTVTNNTESNAKAVKILANNEYNIYNRYFVSPFFALNETYYEFGENADAVVLPTGEDSLADLINVATMNQWGGFVGQNNSVIEAARIGEYVAYEAEIANFEAEVGAICAISFFYDGNTIENMYLEANIHIDSFKVTGANFEEDAYSVMDRVYQLSYVKGLIAKEYNNLAKYDMRNADNKEAYAKVFNIYDEDGKATGETTDTFYWNIGFADYDAIFRVIKTANVPNPDSIRSRVGNCLANKADKCYYAGIYGKYQIEKVVAEDGKVQWDEEGYNYDYLTKDFEELYEEAAEYYEFLQKELYLEYVAAKTELDTLDEEYPLQHASTLADQTLNLYRIIEKFNIADQYIILLDNENHEIEVNFSELANSLNEAAKAAGTVAKAAQKAYNDNILKLQTKRTQLPVLDLAVDEELSTLTDIEFLQYVKENPYLDYYDFAEDTYNRFADWCRYFGTKLGYTDFLGKDLTQEEMIAEVAKIQTITTRTLDVEKLNKEFVKNADGTDAYTTTDYAIQHICYDFYTVEEATAILDAFNAVYAAKANAATAWNAIKDTIEEVGNLTVSGLSIHDYDKVNNAYEAYINYRKAYYLTDADQHIAEEIDKYNYTDANSVVTEVTKVYQVEGEKAAWTAFRNGSYDDFMYNYEQAQIMAAGINADFVAYFKTGMYNSVNKGYRGNSADAVLGIINYESGAAMRALEVCQDIYSRMVAFNDLYDDSVDHETGDECFGWFRAYESEGTTYDVYLELFRLTYQANITIRCIELDSTVSQSNEAYVLYRTWVDYLNKSLSPESAKNNYGAFFAPYEKLISDYNTAVAEYNLNLGNATEFTLDGGAAKSIVRDDDGNYSKFNTAVGDYNNYVGSYNSSSVGAGETVAKEMKEYYPQAKNIWFF